MGADYCCRVVLWIAHAPWGYAADRCGAKGAAEDGMWGGAGWRRPMGGPVGRAERHFGGVRYVTRGKCRHGW